MKWISNDIEVETGVCNFFRISRVGSINGGWKRVLISPNFCDSTLNNHPKSLSSHLYLYLFNLLFLHPPFFFLSWSSKLWLFCPCFELYRLQRKGFWLTWEVEATGYSERTGDLTRIVLGWYPQILPNLSIPPTLCKYVDNSSGLNMYTEERKFFLGFLAMFYSEILRLWPVCRK